MSSHTPGPLHVGIGLGSSPINDVDDVTIGKAWVKDDAVLWAAAPDLLDSLKRLVDALPPYDYHNPISVIVEVARDRIAKAEGKS